MLNQKKGQIYGREEKKIRKQVLIVNKANVDAPEKEDSGSERQREVTKEQLTISVVNLENRKAAGADQIVNEFIKYGDKECLP